MDALKLKIFDVLTEKISVSEFENWLYSSELLDEKLKEDSLMFEVVNVNYRLENSLKMLKNIASTIFDDEDFLVIKIEDNCRKIINTNEPEKIKDYVFNIIQDYNFDIESNVYWEFYSLYYSFEGYEYKDYTKGSLDRLNTITIEYIETILYNLNKCSSIEDKKLVLILEIGSKKEEAIVKKAIDETKKTSLRDRLFSFFRKSL